MNMTKKSILAGALIAIGALFSIAAKPYGNVVQGLCFSVGLFGVLCTGSVLFTGRVLTVRSVFGGERGVTDVAMVLAAVWGLNLVGAVVVALMAWSMGFDATSAAQAKASMPWHEVVARAVLCNVMVCMAVWIAQESAFCSYGTVDALAACALPVACFVACGFEHSVADMLYMPLGFMQGSVGLSDCARVVLLATVGNVVGGVAFSWLVWEEQ